MKTFMKDDLEVRIFPTRKEMGVVSARDFAKCVNELLKTKDTLRVIFAAAPSQNDFLKAAVADKNIDFSRVEAFHMDEYVGLDPEAPQAFGRFLRDRIFSIRKFKSVAYIAPIDSKDPEKTCEEYTKKLNEAPIDIVCMGIGENGHIAFNDPAPGLFNDTKGMRIVNLDDICRMQQVHDGCFNTLDEVPKQALTLTVPMLMKARYHFCMVPASTKAKAVRRMLTGDISEEFPCTILRTQPGAILYLDADSSALL